MGHEARDGDVEALEAKGAELAHGDVTMSMKLKEKTMPPTMRDDGAEMAGHAASERKDVPWGHNFPRGDTGPTRCELIASCVSHKDKRQKQKR